MLGGNADRLQRQKGDGKRGRQQLAHPRQIGLADQDVGFQRQMRAVLFGRRQRQHRDPARGVGFLAMSGQWISVQSRGGTVEAIERSVSLDEFAG